MRCFSFSRINVMAVVSHHGFYLHSGHCSDIKWTCAIYYDCECHYSSIPSVLQHIRIHINHCKLILVKRAVETRQKIQRRPDWWPIFCKVAHFVQLNKLGMDPERACDRGAVGASRWSRSNPNTWQMSNSSSLNVLQLQSNERGPGRRPVLRVPMNLHLSTNLNDGIHGGTQKSLFYRKWREKIGLGKMPFEGTAFPSNLIGQLTTWIDKRGVNSIYISDYWD